MSIITKSLESKEYQEPFILHGKHNEFYCYRVWKWIDGEWLFVLNTSKEEVSK